ncbi:hypothetical protein Taro_013743 [Colocasia esculenta]|uniref:Serine acetyltransferase N-terminal domain-containing protein n=1 Tax=Colocasia esculenta TaxID=4460 RepID=A0A843U792_COLES|nr:hypothetical protein [Colocasia esculenta]
MFGSSILRHSCSVSPWQTHHHGRLCLRAAMATCIAPGFSAAAAGACPCKFIDLICPNFPNLAFSNTTQKRVLPGGDSEEDVDDVWTKVWEEMEADVEEEPISPVLRNLYHNAVFSHWCLESALAIHLAAKLGSSEQIPRGVLFEIFLDAFFADPEI